MSNSERGVKHEVIALHVSAMKNSADRNVRTSAAVTLNWQTKSTLQCNRKQQRLNRVEILTYDQTELQSIKRGSLVETQEDV